MEREALIPKGCTWPQNSPNALQNTTSINGRDDGERRKRHWSECEVREKSLLVAINGKSLSISYMNAYLVFVSFLSFK